MEKTKRGNQKCKHQRRSGWIIYRNKPRETDWDGSDMSKEWMCTQYKKDYCKLRWLERDRGQMMNTVAGSSQERHRGKRMILGKGEETQELTDWQLETPLQNSTHESGNNTRKKKTSEFICPIMQLIAQYFHSLIKMCNFTDFQISEKIFTWQQ
jgi:hypothetical protein